MISEKLLEILRCPACVQTREGTLNYHQETWLVCTQCDRKYPIRNNIPVMLISEGDKWAETEVEDLPVPPPEE